MISGLDYWRKAPLRWWRTRGFGIHSPFAFGFVNEIARERYGYYAYPAINNMCARIGQELRAHRSDDVPACRLSARGARCLFRIASRLGVDSVLSVGHTNGQGEVALRFARRDMHVIVSGAKPDTVIGNVVRWSGNGIALTADFQEAARSLKARGAVRPMLLINSLDTDADVRHIIGIAREILARHGVVVVRNLHRGCRPIETGISSMMTECGAQFTSGRATVFVGFKYLQPQRYLINLPF